MTNHPPLAKAGQLYQSYLVRLWQDDPASPWRILAQSIQSGETRHFVDLESFFAFLAAQTASAPPGVTPDQPSLSGETAVQ